MMPRTLRSALATGAAALAAVALTACSPQLESPSTEKVQTATGQDATSVGVVEEQPPADIEGEVSAGTIVAYVGCDGEAEVEPVSITPDCANPTNSVADITWSEWFADGAVGTGINQATGNPTQLVLNTPVSTLQGTVFSEITVNGESITAQ